MSVTSSCILWMIYNYISGQTFVFKNGCRAQPWRQVHGDICYIEARPHDVDTVLYITAHTSGFYLNKVFFSTYILSPTTTLNIIFVSLFSYLHFYYLSCILKVKLFLKKHLTFTHPAFTVFLNARFSVQVLENWCLFGFFFCFESPVEEQLGSCME